MFLSGYFIISKNWLTQGGAVPPQPERIFELSKHHNVPKINNIYDTVSVCVFITIPMFLHDTNYRNNIKRLHHMKGRKETINGHKPIRIDFLILKYYESAYNGIY